MSLDSEYQIFIAIRDEVNEWIQFYNLDIDKDTAMDLISGIFIMLKNEKVFPPFLLKTVETEEAHYNNWNIK